MQSASISVGWRRYLIINMYHMNIYFQVVLYFFVDNIVIAHSFYRSFTLSFLFAVMAEYMLK
jgi:hypothetical protein